MVTNAVTGSCATLPRTPLRIRRRPGKRGWGVPRKPPRAARGIDTGRFSTFWGWADSGGRWAAVSPREYGVYGVPRGTTSRGGRSREGVGAGACWGVRTVGVLRAREGGRSDVRRRQRCSLRSEGRAWAADAAEWRQPPLPPFKGRMSDRRAGVAGLVEVSGDVLGRTAVAVLRRALVSIPIWRRTPCAGAWPGCGWVVASSTMSGSNRAPRFLCLGPSVEPSGRRPDEWSLGCNKVGGNFHRAVPIARHLRHASNSPTRLERAACRPRDGRSATHSSTEGPGPKKMPGRVTSSTGRERRTARAAVPSLLIQKFFQHGADS